MTKKEAKAWLKQNWKQLSNTGKLKQALIRYFKMPEDPIELPVVPTASIQEPIDPHKIFDGSVFLEQPLTNTGQTL